MGRIKTKAVKNIGNRILKKYFNLFTDDYEKNKRILDVVADFPSKRLRNIVAGYITKVIKLIRSS